MRITRKQNGGNMARAQEAIDGWVTNGDVEAELHLNHFNLTILPRLPNNLKKLNCRMNKLISLPKLPDGLTSLDCEHNELKNLPKLPDSLTFLNCADNYKLTILPKLPNGLRILVCERNLFRRLPTLPDSLDKLFCDDNKLKRLPKLPNGLNILFCNYNEISMLPTLPNSLRILRCENNNLPSIFYIRDDEVDVVPEYDLYQDVVYENEIRYIERIRKLQNIIIPIRSHATEKKRNVFANTTFKNMPKNVVKEIANYMDEEDLENININSLKPKNVKKGETKKKHKK